MAVLTNDQIINLLYKKYLDLPNTNPNRRDAGSESNISVPKNIYIQNTFSQYIPLSNPNDYYTVATYPTSFGTTIKKISSNYPYIAYYEKLPLVSARPFNNNSFTHSNLNKIILKTYHDSYSPTVFNFNATRNITQFGINPALLDSVYINIDSDSGVLTFYNILTSNIVSFSNPPVISFYRYEGLIGNDTSMIKIQEFLSLGGTSNIDPSTAIALIDSRFGARRIYLPPTNIIYGKYIIIKDIGGAATSNLITLQTVNSDIFENNSNISYINTNFGSVSLIAQKGKWSAITSDGGSITNIGISSLSSIVSYGLSTVAAQPHYGLSSLSSIVSYGLSTVAAKPHIGVSSLSSIVSYGLSTIAAKPHTGVSSLSSIVSYGLSTVWNYFVLSNTNTNSNVLNLSSIISYGLSSVNIIVNNITCNAAAAYYSDSVFTYNASVSLSNPTFTSNTINYNNYYNEPVTNSNITYCNTTINNTTTIYSNTNSTGVSSLSSIVGYGLSTVAAQPQYGVSSLSSIVSYGLSSLVNGTITMTGQLIINSNSSNPVLTVNGPMNLIDTLYGTSNTIYVNSNLLYFNNNILYGSRQLQPQFITFT